MEFKKVFLGYLIAAGALFTGYAWLTGMIMIIERQITGTEGQLVEEFMQRTIGKR